MKALSGHLVMSVGESCVRGIDTRFTTECHRGQIILVKGQLLTVKQVISDVEFTVWMASAGNGVEGAWIMDPLFPSAPERLRGLVAHLECH